METQAVAIKVHDLSDDNGEVVGMNPARDAATTMARYIEQAKVMADVIEQRKLYTVIQGKKYVRVEGWTLLGALNGLSAYVESVTTGTDAAGNFTATAVVCARTTQGIDLTRGVALCSKAEKTWSSRDQYAILGMAQTRATSRAFRGLGFILELAGFMPTPEAEMPQPATTNHLELNATDLAAIKAAFAQGDKAELAAWWKGHGFDHSPDMAARGRAHVAEFLAFAQSRAALDIPVAA